MRPARPGLWANSLRQARPIAQWDAAYFALSVASFLLCLACKRWA